jgi:hypothetical protein
MPHADFLACPSFRSELEARRNGSGFDRPAEGLSSPQSESQRQPTLARETAPSGFSHIERGFECCAPDRAPGSGRSGFDPGSTGKHARPAHGSRLRVLDATKAMPRKISRLMRRMAFAAQSESTRPPEHVLVGRGCSDAVTHGEPTNLPLLGIARRRGELAHPIRCPEASLRSWPTGRPSGDVSQLDYNDRVS